MGGEDLLTIVDQWSRSLSPPRALLVRLLELANAVDSSIFDLRLLHHDNDILTPIAAAVSSESGSLRLDAYPALAQAVREIRVTYLPPDRYIFPAVVDLDCAPSYLLDVSSRSAMAGDAREQLQFMARMIAQALELRDLRALSGFTHAMTAMGEKAQEAVSARLHGTLSSLMGARDISQMAGIIARDLLSSREVLTLNELRYDESGQLIGWRPVADNSGVANPRRDLKLELAWHRVGEYLRESIVKGEPFIANSLGPIERPLVGTTLFEWMQLNGIASAVFYPISHPTRTTAVMAVFSTVQRNVSEAAVQSFVKLAERMALLTIHNQHLSEVTVREYWATQMLRTSQHLFDAQDASDITRAAIDALPANVRLVALTLFDVALKPGRWPDWLRVESLSSRAETKRLAFSADQPDQQDTASQQMILKLIEGKPVLERLENGRLRHFAPNIADGLVARGCTAIAYIGLVADDALYGMLIIGAEGVEALQPLGFVLRDMSVTVSQSVQRLMSLNRQQIPDDLSAIVQFSTDVVKARGREDLMFAVRRCLGEQYAMVTWIDVSADHIVLQRPHEIKIALMLRGERVETMHDYPLHQDMDSEQYEWYRRTWLTSSRFGKVVHHLSEEAMGNDPVLPAILREHDQVYSVVALPVLDDGQLVAQVYVAFLSSSHEATEQFIQLCDLIRDLLSLKAPSMRDASTAPSNPNAPLLQVINDLAIRLLTVRDERMLLTEGARSFATALNVDHAGITILRDDQSADVVAEYPDAGLVGLNIPSDNPYLVMTVRDRVPLPVEDVRTDANLTPENREALAASGIRKMLFLPMLDQNQKCFGSIGLDVMREDYEFDLNMVEIARTLANQLAMLYLSLRQVRTARRQAEQLASITELTSALVEAQRDDEVYAAVAAKIRDILPADDLWILIDTSWLNGTSAWPLVGEMPLPDNVQVVMQFENGTPNKPNEPITFMLDDTPAGKARSGETVSIKDIAATELQPLLSSRPARAILAAPIKVGERIVGVIEVDSHAPDTYSRADETVFDQIASQLSGALNRARALDVSKRQAQTQAVVAKYTNTVQAAGGHQSTMVEGARGYQGLLGANQVNIQLGIPPQQPDKPNGPGSPQNGVNGDKR